MALVTLPGGIQADIEPYIPVSYGGVGSFSSRTGTGESEPIIVRFLTPINGINIRVWDADYPGNEIQVFNAQDQLIATYGIPTDNTPGNANSFIVQITENNIAYLKLIPGIADFTWYSIPQKYRVRLSSSPSANNRTEALGQTDLMVFEGTQLSIFGQPDENHLFLQLIDQDNGAELFKNPNQNKAANSHTITVNWDRRIQGIYQYIPPPEPPPPSPTPTPEPEPTVTVTAIPLPTLPPTPTPAPLINATVIGNIKIVITRLAPPVKTTSKIKIKIAPAATLEQRTTLKYPFKVNVLLIDVNISQPLLTVAYDFLSDAIANYIDEERELKTLLNYGEDRQSVALAWRYNTDLTGMQVKLLQPVPVDIDLNSNVFLSREVVKSLIDKIRVRYAPPIDATPYLRPKNTYVQTDLDLGKSLKNITMKKLQLRTGSVGETDEYKNISFEDQIFRQWYSYDFNSAELNIDFTNYNNFVFYGSAALRLASFREKLKLIEKLDTQQLQFVTQSITGSTTLVGRLALQEETAKLSKQKEDIIRGFDRYEQFLYFTPSSSNLPYTASAYYADAGYEYHSSSYWPKTGNVLYPVYSETAQEWFDTQYAIAQRFDDFNENNLINTIPMHVREDEDSAAYITFVAMIGHFFDMIKPYIDQLEYIYDRDIDPNIGLSKDLVNEVAEAFGFRLPTVNSVYNLSNTILGTEEYEPRRDYTVETYKRLLHNLPFFAKAKGTRTALNSLLSTLGITPQLINVKESGAPTGSYYVYDEFSTGLDFDESNPKHVIIPMGGRSPRSLQFNLTVAKSKTMTILTADDKWSLRAYQHPTITNLGRIELTSGSNHDVILSSNYAEIFGDELLNVTIQTFTSQSFAKMYVTQVHGEDTLFYSEVSESVNANKLVPLWTSSNFLYIGGSGSLIQSPFDGTIDEFRLWGINLSEEMVLNTAFDPGSNAGDTYEDPVEHLYVQLSFNALITGSLPSINNESPYKNLTLIPNLTSISTNGVIASDFSRYNRTVRQLAPEAGATAYMTSKVKVASAPVFNPDSLDKNGNKILSRTRSILRPEVKKLQAGRNKVIISMSPTQIVNQNIIRNLGLENINAVLGAPTDLYQNFNTTLATLKSYYQQYYYVNVNVNRYIRIMSELGSILDQIVGYFIPSRATVLKGIVIEPNILERVKIPPLKNLRVYGGNTRKTLTAPGSRTGSKSDFGATFTVTDNIRMVNDSSTKASYNLYTLQHEDWYTNLLISHSLKARKTVSINLNQIAPIGNYQTVDIQHEDWYIRGLISQSIKPKRKVRINVYEADYQQLAGSNQTYFVQHEYLSAGPTGSGSVPASWYSDWAISQSLKPKRQVSINSINTRKLFGSQQTYELQHEKTTAQFEKIVSQSLLSGSYIDKEPFYPKKKSRISLVNNDTLNTQYRTYDIQHEYLPPGPTGSGSVPALWYSDPMLYRSGSKLPKKQSRITRFEDQLNIIDSSYQTFTQKHREFKNAPTTESIIRNTPVNIEIYSDQTNRIPFNNAYKGSEGAEPYSRIYPRKLTTNEIKIVRPYFETNPEIVQEVKSLIPIALYDIPPSADFRDVGVTTYFNNPTGIYTFPQTIKSPVYRNPLNQTWDIDEQRFIGIATWSYGTRYNYNDVVYQDVETQYISATEPLYNGLSRDGAEKINDENAGIRAGNGRYYVFTTKPSYINPENGSAFYSGSVPSYVPPSIDKENWEPLRFRPTEKRIEKRLIFDTFVFSDPAATNYRITAVDPDRNNTLPARFIDPVNINSVLGNSYTIGEVAANNIMALFAVQSNYTGLRLRLYRTANTRNADINRSIDVRPEPSDGVLLDVLLTETEKPQLTNPITTVMSDDVTLDGIIYYTINNEDSTPKSNIALYLFYFALEVQLRVPRDYLRKHYKFFRDNSTATKRRNYLGCKNTVDTTIDGLPPIQVFLSEGTEITVSETQDNNEIIPGGGGTLNVT